MNIWNILGVLIVLNLFNNLTQLDGCIINLIIIANTNKKGTALLVSLQQDNKGTIWSYKWLLIFMQRDWDEFQI